MPENIIIPRKRKQFLPTFCLDRNIFGSLTILFELNSEYKEIPAKYYSTSFYPAASFAFPHVYLPEAIQIDRSV